MFYPFQSFLLAIIFSIILFFYITIIIKSPKPLEPQISLIIDAEIYGNSNIEGNSQFIKNSKIKNAITKNNKNNIDHQHIEPLNEINDKNKDLSNKNLSQTIMPIFQPLPEIPEDMRFEAFQSKIVAKFFINVAGDVENIELLKASNNPKLNLLLIKSLKKWKFPTQSESFEQIINVKFLVE